MNTQEWRERQNKLPGRISRSSFVKTHYYKNGSLFATINCDGDIEIPNISLLPIRDSIIIDKEFLDSFTKAKEEIFDEEGFKAARNAAQNQFVLFMEEFKQALFEYHEISGNPKRELFFSILQSQTKDVGEMFGIAEEWVDLIK